jgi:hypothetical protein
MNDQAISALQELSPNATPVDVIATRLLHLFAAADEALRHQLYGRMHCATSALAPTEIQPAQS